ncbi:MAG: hypothetical protein L6R37_007890 [Teloschistes peruensis]|nr:MAG: hypothetical protein L6R37_007890 [Teloschistes peruensis]
MTAAGFTSILTALKILHDSTDDQLKPHWPEVLALSQKLQLYVTKSPVPRLATGLNQDLLEIEQFISVTDPSRTELQPSIEAVDPRVADILGSKPANTRFAQLRQGLSRRSWAQEFSEWEMSSYGTCSIEARARNPERDFRAGLISEFLQTRASQLTTYHGPIKHALTHGIKMLVCEMLAGTAGCSLLLMFRPTQFRDLKYKTELAELAFELCQQEPLEEFAQQYDAWLWQWQHKYNGRFI